MAQQRLNQESNTFVGGLITEASPLSFPPNTSKEEQNFVLNRNGSRRRRRGMDIETGRSYLSGHTGSSDPAVRARDTYSVFRWEQAGDDAATILVVRIGNKLFMHEGDIETLTDSTKRTEVTGVLLGSSVPVQFTSINGKLIASRSGNSNLIVISRSSTGVYSTSTERLTIRDLWGVDDGRDVDERTTGTITTDITYNLLNQGWPSARITKTYGTSDNAYPANSDVPWVNRAANGSWDTNLSDNFGFGTTPAPKGKYIIDAFNRGASRLTESGQNVQAESVTGEIGALATFSGRVFYAVSQTSVSNKEEPSPDFRGTLFFSQVVEADSQITRCYQAADPTGEETVGLVASDGGFIKIPEMGEIIKFVPTESNLMIIADNGVWQISGRDGIFRADEYNINRVSNVGALSEEAVVELEQGAMYWSQAGIYALLPDERSGRISPRNMTETTIQSLYDSIPPISRTRAKGFYDDAGRTVRWLYASETPATLYNRELVYDLVLNAWSVNHLSTSAGTSVRVVSDYIPLKNVTDDYKYLIANNDASPATTSTYGFGNYHRRDFKDWGEDDAKAIVVTGTQLYGDTQRRKRINYLTCHFERTETGFMESGSSLVAIRPSGCLVTARFDFSNSQASGKHGRAIQAYRLRRNYFPTGTNDTFDYGQEVITTKSKMRGSGKSVNLIFESEPDKDCVLLGWAVDVEAETNV